jgi:hypothetical protein
MTSPAENACNAVAALVDAEFSAEGWETQHDKFGRSKGMEIAEDEAAIAVYPEAERERQGQVQVLDVDVTLQFHLGYAAEPDETIERDPRVVAEFADRLRRAFQGAASSGNTADFWYMRLQSVTYPDDPTGNKTRFEAAVLVECENPASLA